jgi:phosphatidate cytidylyltransferase
MTDDIWRPEDSDSARRRPGRLEAEMDAFDDSEFGGPLFGNTSEHQVTPAAESAEDPPANEDWPESPSGGSGRLQLDEDGSGAMPHWTEDATGEVPAIAPAAPEPDATDDLDVWSTFTSDAPVWKEGDPVDAPTGSVPTAPSDPTGEISWEDAPVEPVAAAVDVNVDADAAGEATELHDVVVPAPREPARITIGTDPSGMPRRPEPQRRGGGGQGQRPPSAGGPPPGAKRNLPVAIATGLALAAVFVAAAMWRPLGAIIFVCILLGLAAIEYFSKVTEKGYRPAVAAGVAACVAAPAVAYWVGEKGIPLVLALAFFAGAMGFIGSDSIEVGPMPNMAITMLGIVWIGVLGSFAALIIRYSNFFGGLSIGTDTLVLLAVGVVANDVGAYFVGSAFGRTPLRGWISPNKSVEGFLGGTILTLVVMLLVGMQNASDTWSDTSHLLMLGIVISIFAPLGDLTESMFKRNLDVKDFGSLIKGHGGVLDRFDGFLFALPAVYYLMLVVEPWSQLGS